MFDAHRQARQQDGGLDPLLVHQGEPGVAVLERREHVVLGERRGVLALGWIMHDRSQRSRGVGGVELRIREGVGALVEEHDVVAAGILLHAEAASGVPLFDVAGKGIPCFVIVIVGIDGAVAEGHGSLLSSGTETIPRSR